VILRPHTRSVSHGLGSPLEETDSSCRFLGSSHEVSSPYSAHAIWVYLTRVYLARYVPLSGFLNLLVVFSSNCDVVLFHTTCTHGIRPAELSPWTQHLILIEWGHLSLLHPSSESTEVFSSESLHLIYPKAHSIRPTHSQQVFNAQVRSHPVPVLPYTGGRCSLEHVRPCHFVMFKLWAKPGLWFHLVALEPCGFWATLWLCLQHTGAPYSVTVGLCLHRLLSRPDGKWIYTLNSLPFQSIKNPQSPLSQGMRSRSYNVA